MFARSKRGIYRESKREEERTRWRVREREIHTIWRGEASTDHPTGEGLG